MTRIVPKRICVFSTSLAIKTPIRTAVGVFICIEEAISCGDVFASAVFQIKKQKAEQTKDKKINATQEITVALVNKLAKTFSSKINAAIVSSKKPIAIVQNVSEVLEKSFEYFLVKITEMAKQAADARVNDDPKKKSEEKVITERFMCEKSSIEPPINPRNKEVHLLRVSFSFKTTFPKARTSKGEVSMIAAETLEEIYLSPANCIGYNKPKAEVPISRTPSHSPVFRGISILFPKNVITTKRAIVAIPKRKLDAVNGPHA